MQAVQEDIDTLASLEERINRAVQLINTLRSDNEQLQHKLSATEQDVHAARLERDEAQSMSAAFEKENNDLEQRVKDLSEELNTLRGERKQVKTRIEKLLSQLDLSSAS
jgi:chromosome segregation ATPase